MHVFEGEGMGEGLGGEEEEMEEGGGGGGDNGRERG